MNWKLVAELLLAVMPARCPLRGLGHSLTCSTSLSTDDALPFCDGEIAVLSSANIIPSFFPPSPYVFTMINSLRYLQINFDHSRVTLAYIKNMCDGYSPELVFVQNYISNQRVEGFSLSGLVICDDLDPKLAII